jgi:hypothetical protein
MFHLIKAKYVIIEELINKHMFSNVPPDPLKHCEYWKDKHTCPHVDGMYCDVRDCNILKVYRKESIVVTPILFEFMQTVRHVNTGELYLIFGLPDQYRIEATGEPAYVYGREVSSKWIRPQKEMEDGRFVSHSFSSGEN